MIHCVIVTKYSRIPVYIEFTKGGKNIIDFVN